MYTHPEPGPYSLRVEGLGEPHDADEHHHLVFRRPHRTKSIGCIPGIFVGSGLFIGNLVFSLLHLLAEE